MKKVLFIDEKKYRFAHYYENKSWWIENGVNPIFKDYEKKINKYKIYSGLLFNRPDYIVIVQLSTKNLILLQLASLLRIKVIFWQHGVFEYPIIVKAIFKYLPMKLSSLLALSEHDIEGISSIFGEVKSCSVIKHYDLAKLNFSKEEKSGDELRVAYLGQIVTSEQVYGSGASIMEKYLGDFDLFSELIEEIETKKLPIVIYAKKHPGDKSFYLENLSKKYKCLVLAKNDDIFNCHVAMSYFSTLMLAFLELNQPVVQLPMTNGSFRLDMKHYDMHDNLTSVKSVEDFLRLTVELKNHKIANQVQNHFESISKSLLKVITCES
jgi:hypothetical protein